MLKELLNLVTFNMIIFLTISLTFYYVSVHFFLPGHYKVGNNFDNTTISTTILKKLMDSKFSKDQLRKRNGGR